MLCSYLGLALAQEMHFRLACCKPFMPAVHLVYNIIDLISVVSHGRASMTHCWYFYFPAAACVTYTMLCSSFTPLHRPSASQTVLPQSNVNGVRGKPPADHVFSCTTSPHRRYVNPCPAFASPFHIGQRQMHGTDKQS